MGTAEDLFAGIRSSDLRFDNVHILAEYIARAQRFADDATRIEESAERLLQGAMRTTEEGVKQFEAALTQMRSELRESQGTQRTVIGTVGRDIAQAVADAHATGANYILQAAEVARQRNEELASGAGKISDALARLEQAAELVSANRKRASQELESLQVFKDELTQFERESQGRISEARAALYQGVGLWQRLTYVVFPPVPVVRESKAPSRSRLSREEPKSPSAATKTKARAPGTATSASGHRK